jgi:integrase
MKRKPGGTEKIPGSHHLFPRGKGGFAFIKTVPLACRPAFGGKLQIWKAVAGDLIQARRQDEALFSYYEGLFARLRHQSVQTALNRLGNADAVRQAIEILGLGKPEPFPGMSADEFTTIPAAEQAQALALHNAIRDEATRDAQEHADAVVIERAFTAPVELPPLSKVATAWMDDTNAAPGSRKNYRTAIKHFTAILGGDLTMPEITETHAFAFKDSLAGKARNTIKSSLKAMHAVCAWAATRPDMGTYKVNVFAGVKAARKRVSDETAKRVFDRAELKAIRDHLSRAWRDANTEPERKREWWLCFLIAAYLGLRLREVANLARVDLRTDANTGIVVLDVRPDAETGRRVKNAESIRILPVPSAIVTELLAHRDSLPADTVRLFPKLISADTLTQKLQAELTTIGITGAKFHTLRDTAEDIMRETIPDAFRYRIQGRADPHGSARVYGRGVGLKATAEWVEKLDPFNDRNS